MLIDISDILPVCGKTKELDIRTGMDYFTVKNSKYPLKPNDSLKLLFTNIGNKKILLEGTVKVTLVVPCDRCLEDTELNLNIEISKEIDMNDADENSENAVYLNGTVFDTEAFVYDEILVHMPMKVVCDEDCKGICKTCGVNLNQRSCDCSNHEIDPRMSKFIEVFNQFKEV